MSDFTPHTSSLSFEKKNLKDSINELSQRNSYSSYQTSFTKKQKDQTDIFPEAELKDLPSSSSATSPASSTFSYQKSFVRNPEKQVDIFPEAELKDLPSRSSSVSPTPHSSTTSFSSPSASFSYQKSFVRNHEKQVDIFPEAELKDFSSRSPSSSLASSSSAPSSFSYQKSFELNSEDEEDIDNFTDYELIDDEIEEDDFPVLAKKSFFEQYPFKTKKHNIIAFSIAILLLVVLLVSLLVAFLAPNNNENTVVQNMVEDKNYNPNAFVLPTDQEGKTILGETERAGDEYLENTLFLGDSNTVRMQMYRDFTCVTLQNSVAVEGMGIQSVTTLDCAGFQGMSGMATIPEAVKILQPERIVITFGTNNAGSMNVDTFIANYKEALDAIHEAYPYSEIIIGAVPPIAKQHINESLTMTAVDEYNLALVTFAEEEGYKFLNWSEVLKDSSTGYAKANYTLSSDGVHLTRTGMEAMFEYIRTHAYITEDKRPKPLNDIPERTGTLLGLVTSEDTQSSSSSSSSTSSTRSGVQSSNFAANNDPESNYANVSFSASGSGSIQINGNKSSSTTIQVAIGGTCPTAVAIPDNGYKFSHWTCSVGTITSSSATLSGFKVSSSLEDGQTVYVTAVFVKTSASSTPTTTRPTSSSSSVTTQPPSSSTPPSATQPVSSAPSSTPAPSSAPPPPVSSAPPEPPSPPSESPDSEPPVDSGNEDIEG